MRQSKTPLRGSVTQNNVSVRMRAREQAGIGFLTRLGLLGAALLFIMAILIWGWRSGWPQHEVDAVQNAALSVSQKAQFKVKSIDVEGRNQSDKADIFDAIGTEQGAPIFAFDAKAAAARLGKLPWVNSAVIERRLPDTVAVILTERVPAARWQHDDRFYVIDTEGHVLPSAKADDFSSLPLVVGTGADRETQSLLTLLKSFPDIRNKTGSAVRVGDRRWDLHLNPKIIVRLPEQDVSKALHRLSVLIEQEKILDRDIVAIDLRQPDRLIIEPSPSAKPTGAP